MKVNSMSVSHYTILPIALLMLWVMATNTWAVDVGGTYTGTATCTRYSHDGTVTKTTRDIIALINQGVQVGGVSELNINVNFSQLGDMNGRAIADAKKPEKEGEFTAVLCSNNPNSPPPMPS